MKRLLVVLAVATAAVPAVAVPPAQAGGGCHRQTARDMRGVTATLIDNCFDPVVLRVQPGQRVRWVNKDQAPHTVTGAAGGWGSYEELAAGKSIAWRFDKAGVFPYVCMLHPGMVGAVVVGDGVSAETTLQDASIAYVDDAPPAAAAAPAAAQPQIEPVAASSTRDTGPIVAGLLALAAAVLIAAVVLLARRTPTAEPHPQV